MLLQDKLSLYVLAKLPIIMFSDVLHAVYNYSTVYTLILVTVS